MTTLPDDKEIIEAVKAKITGHLHDAKFHMEQFEKFKRMLEAYGDINIANKLDLSKFPKPEDFFHVVTDEKHNQNVNGKLKRRRNENKQTFESIVLEIFADGKPRLVSELIKEYHEKTGLLLSSKDFSSKLSIRSQKGRIKNTKFVDFPIEKRYWWGLSEFFDGAVLKPSFEAIVHEKYKSMI